MITQPTFKAAPSIVGSFPHADAEELVDRIAAELTVLPAWPQLPARDFRESMYIQYSEGLPGVVLDAAAEKMHLQADDRFHAELEGFYQAVVEEDVEHFAISREYALGLHLFLERFGPAGAGKARWLKGQVTGPFSFAMTVTDENKRSIAYNPELLEVAVQGIANKARWMARRLRERATEGAIVVLDEPYLCSFGSAFVNVSREDTSTAINEAVAAIHKEGALAGLHCCGNTDWSLALQTDIDLLNLDAFEFFQGLPLYPDDLRRFVDKGGILSLGIVPTSEKAAELGAERLADELAQRADLLQHKGIDRQQLYAQSLVTPACGMGSKTVEVADAAMKVLFDLAALLRQRGTF